jgi:hypothetical protein
MTERIGYLEAEVERLSQEIGRLAEEGQFLEKLLEERQRGAGALPPGDETP